VSDAPDYCQPVIGWRAWRALERGGEVYLASVFHRDRWPCLDPLAGSCQRFRVPWRRRRERHAPPSSDCVCGIYAAATLEVACAYAPVIRSRSPGPYAVVGSVALWGDVIEHTDGWRASFAYPMHLHVLYADRRGAQHAVRIAESLERYRVPVDTLQAWSSRDAVEALAA
jgi:hypothetical protein